MKRVSVKLLWKKTGEMRAKFLRFEDLDTASSLGDPVVSE
jgi:hypothetical protein